MHGNQLGIWPFLFFPTSLPLSPCTSLGRFSLSLSPCFLWNGQGPTDGWLLINLDRWHHRAHNFNRLKGRACQWITLTWSNDEGEVQHFWQNFVNRAFQTKTLGKKWDLKKFSLWQVQGLHLTAKIQDRGYGLGSLRLKPRFETELELYFILRRPKPHGSVWSLDRFNRF